MHFAHGGHEYTTGAASSMPIYTVVGLVVLAFIAGAAFYMLAHKGKEPRDDKEDV